MTFPNECPEARRKRNLQFPVEQHHGALVEDASASPELLKPADHSAADRIHVRRSVMMYRRRQRRVSARLHGVGGANARLLGKGRSASRHMEREDEPEIAGRAVACPLRQDRIRQIAGFE